MHDWTLMGIRVDWASASVQISALDETSTERRLVFERVTDVLVDRSQPWGVSSSINEVTWKNEGQTLSVAIEMQSGGRVTIAAGSCSLDGTEVKV